MGGKQQACLSSFFKKKTTTEQETSIVKKTLLPPPAPSLSTSGLQKQYQYDPTNQSHVQREDANSLEQKKRHEAFVKTFGDLEEKRALKRQRVDLHETTLGGIPDEDLDQEYPSADDSPSSTTSNVLFDTYANKNSPIKTQQPSMKQPFMKYTPLEQQVVDLKQKHPDVLLAIEVGYKFRFFGEDAKIASKVLHIAHFIDRNFYVASIPVHRLSVHVRRLVHAGYKVGVVRQTETAALKAVGSNRSAPFERKLQQLYTKGTYVDEMTLPELDGKSNMDIKEAPSSSNYLLCVVEQNRGGSGSDEFVKIGIVAVQPSSGDIIYDAFDDGYMRSELETRLLHIEPCEVLFPFSISKPTEKVARYLMDHGSTSWGETIRVERLAANNGFCNNYDLALSYVTDFYAKQQTDQQSELIGDILKLPDVVVKALAITIHYLTEFGLQHAFQLTKYFTHFSSHGHMIIKGNTMVNLEIYRNSTNLSEQGSLFSILNHTSTSFGRRLLKKWVGRPLIDINRLNKRTQAVEELMITDNPKKARSQDLLKMIPDLEKGLCRINYGSSSPVELVNILDAFYKVAQAFEGFQHSQTHRFQSDMLNIIFDTLPTVHDVVLEFQSRLNPGALNTPKCNINLLRSDENHWPELQRGKQAKNELEEELSKMKKTYDFPMEYKNVAGIEYLIEVKNSVVKKVPPQWIKMSGTKAVSRFHSPFVINKLKERERYRERLALDADAAYRGFLRSIAEHYGLFRDVIHCLAQLDCLFSLSVVASLPNYVKPTFTSDTRLSVVNGRHPMVERFLSTSYVPNDIQFDKENHRTLILTGPNMGGKSSYIRQVALISMMAQIGSFVPAESAEIGILDGIFTRMGASDNMMKGESTFMVELHETADIMKQATSRSLVILDELGRGTSTHDGMAIAYAVLDYFITKIQSITLFVTHYPALGTLADIYPDSTTNGYMSFIEDGQHEIPKVIFLYKLVSGVATKSYGLNVAYLARLPLRVLETAKQKSEEMETMQAQRSTNNKQQQIFKNLFECIMQEDVDGFKKIYSTMESID
ncbi:putative DNA mismatch repair protein Msh3 [Halteromyces radiatus]|uniref:putative DNA mismatch repair protein Msh3 n=1 Tax=Halteromyces radiatus TaxID=101107 RepID=UPI00221E5581|nr:putative DNA mismatch repair protein Msh3 [Halteromyces radiatus]KAI8084735.1 putative DNA mismatch repair protein Msh3 [Halteromyces radiatus]